MDLKILPAHTALNSHLIPLQDPQKLCPEPFSDYTKRTKPLEISRVWFDIPTHVNISDRHRSAFADGWTPMSQVVKYAHELTPLKELQPRLSSTIGVFILFRHLMCIGPEVKDPGVYVTVAPLSGETSFVCDCDTVPGFNGSMYVPTKWATRVLRYSERGVQGVYMDQSAPPCLYARMHDGLFRPLEPNRNTYGWNMCEGGKVQLTDTQVSLLI